MKKELRWVLSLATTGFLVALAFKIISVEIHWLVFLLVAATVQVIFSARAVFAVAMNAKGSLKALKEIKKFFDEVAVKTGGLSKEEILADALDLYNMAVDEAATGRWIASVDPYREYPEGAITILEVESLKEISNLIDQVDEADNGAPDEDKEDD